MVFSVHSLHGLRADVVLTFRAWRVWCGLERECSWKTFGSRPSGAEVKSQQSKCKTGVYGLTSLASAWDAVLPFLVLAFALVGWLGPFFQEHGLLVVRGFSFLAVQIELVRYVARRRVDWFCFKLQRASGGCLGTECRRRTCKRRYAQGSCKRALILRFPNGGTRPG